MAKKKKNKQQQPPMSPLRYLKERMRSVAIGKCYMSSGRDAGLITVIVSRQHTGGNISMASFLVDLFCMGVTDADYKMRISPMEFQSLINQAPDMSECSYEEAHNRIYGAIAFAEDAGISPCKEFALAQYFLEEDTEKIALIEYEYGKNGKHFLMAHNLQELNTYLPLLKKNLGNDFTYTVENDDNEYDGDYDDPDFDFSQDKEPLWLKDYGPTTEYNYKHPQYHYELNVENEWLVTELAKEEYEMSLTKEIVEKIMLIPHESLQKDLENIILHNLMLTCDEIPNDYAPNDGYNPILSNCLMLLAEVGNESSTLDIALELLRQSPDFCDYHFGDMREEIFIPLLYRAGRNHLDRFMNFMKEPNLFTYLKLLVPIAVKQVAIEEPERKGEVVEWFAQLLTYAEEAVPQTRYIDHTLCAFIISDTMDLNAMELLPTIKPLFDKNLVNLGVCGSYQKVEREMKKPYPYNEKIPSLLERLDQII